MPLWGAARIVLHVVPLAAFDAWGPEPTSRFDLSTVRVPPLFAEGAGRQRYNFDGVLSYDVDRENNLCIGYTQVFRNGAIEGVDTFLLRSERWDRKDANWIPNVTFDEGIVSTTRNYLAAIESWGLGGPVLVMLSLVGVRGYFMGVGSVLYRGTAEIDRDVVVVPEAWVEAVPPGCPLDEVARLIRGSLDVVWQAAGLPGSHNFTPEGKWQPRKS